MKIYIYSFLALVAFTFVFTSCNKDTEAIPDIPNGAMVLLESVSTTEFFFDKISSESISGTLRDVSNNVQSAEFYAQLTRTIASGKTFTSARKLVTTVTDVNGSFSMTTNQVAAALGSIIDNVTDTTKTTTYTLASATDFVVGDKIEFINQLTTKEGKTVVRDDISPNLNGNVGQRSFFDFSVLVICDIATDKFLGKYTMSVNSETGSAVGAFKSEDVTLKASGTAGRVVDTYTFFTDKKRPSFTLTMLCGNVYVYNTSTAIGCSIKKKSIQTGTTPGTYNLNDDSSFTVNLYLPAVAGCSAEGAVNLTFTKK